MQENILGIIGGLGPMATAYFLELTVKMTAAYRDQEWWSRAAIWNVAHAGKFSSDRTIQEYVDGIWHLKKIER